MGTIRVITKELSIEVVSRGRKSSSTYTHVKYRAMFNDDEVGKIFGSGENPQEAIESLAKNMEDHYD
jgi:hypothetical protein